MQAFKFQTRASVTTKVTVEVEELVLTMSALRLATCTFCPLLCMLLLPVEALYVQHTRSTYHNFQQLRMPTFTLSTARTLDTYSCVPLYCISRTFPCKIGRILAYYDEAFLNNEIVVLLSSYFLYLRISSRDRSVLGDQKDESRTMSRI